MNGKFQIHILLITDRYFKNLLFSDILEKRGIEDCFQGSAEVKYNLFTSVKPMLILP